MEYITLANEKNFTFELTNCDGSPVDLSTSTVKFILKENKLDDDARAILSGEYINSDTNIISFQFDAEQTKRLTEGKHYAALKIFREGNLNEEVWNDDVKVVRGTFND